MNLQPLKIPPQTAYAGRSHAGPITLGIQDGFGDGDLVRKRQIITPIVETGVIIQKRGEFLKNATTQDHRVHLNWMPSVDVDDCP